jgi:hypothetical protein
MRFEGALNFRSINVTDTIDFEKEPDDPDELRAIIANAQQKLELIKSID